MIGIVNAKYSSGSGYTTSATIEGIGFSIPIDDALDILDDLIQHGYVTGKPYLGISVSTVSSVTAQQYSNYVVGALVNSVASGSCAETAGLQVGDIITAADGTEITTYEELIDAKNSHKAGEVMELTVFRDGSYVTLAVTLDEEVPDASSTPGSSSQDDSAQQDENIYGGQQDGSSQGGSSRGGTYSFPFGGGFGGLW